MMKAISD